MSKYCLKLWRSLFILPIKTYQLVISPMLPNTCRHLPTCSQYTIEAINTYGVFKGILKGFIRILRCNPFGSSGYDPIKK
ncbi:MAG: membrane protein insertion efficiency factor YidD [Proteobacteria bacterium]|nr:membrane protein insertion efficiency factor YidD [Pseudomonadota bacterium]